MKRGIFFVYGIVCYLLFLAVYAWLAGFVGNFGVPKSIDSAPSNTMLAAGIDIALVVLFGLQHSIMSRPWFKAYWTRLVPQPVERSTYLLFSFGTLAVMMWLWQGLDVVIWDVKDPLARGVLWGLFAAGWLGVPLVTLMISHFDLFGMRQVWLYMRGQEYKSLPFRTPYLYARVRHPLYVAWAIAFWATPTMTLGHVIFAATMTLYMGIATIFEERDLMVHFGEMYRDYRRRVPMFIPNLFGGVKDPAKHMPQPVPVLERAPR
jgi:protein-S-isoprenylcysteine O-methyltransferase Ste14